MTERQKNIRKIATAYKKYIYAVERGSSVQSALLHLQEVCQGYCQEIVAEGRQLGRKELAEERKR